MVCIAYQIAIYQTACENECTDKAFRTDDLFVVIFAVIFSDFFSLQTNRMVLIITDVYNYRDVLIPPNKQP